MHTQLPATLVLGAATSPTALRALLPLPAVAALPCRDFKLTPALARMESIFSEVPFSLQRLLHCSPGLPGLLT